MKEYKYIQSAIDKIDGQRFLTRNWAIIAAGALFTVALSAKVPLVAFAGIATTAFFAFIEGILIDMIVPVLERCKRLDDLVNSYLKAGRVPDTYVFGLAQSFRETFGLRRLLARVFTRGRIHVTAFYGGLLLVNAAGGIAVMLR